MKDRLVSQEEIDAGYIRFCKDLGAEGETRQEMEKYLKENNIVVAQKEDKQLIWFEQLENNKVKYYSEPIRKFVQEFEKEIRMMIAADNPIGHICLYSSMLPEYKYNQQRKGKITQKEKERNERDSNKKHFQWDVDRAFENSVFGYILFDGKGIIYPTMKHRSTQVVYDRCFSREMDDCDSELFKEILSNKDRYSWYKLGEQYFIVRNSKKKEYMFLVDEKDEKLKIAKLIDDRVVLEDIVKDEKTIKVESEIDKYLRQTSYVDNTPYIKYCNNCFYIVKREDVPIKKPIKEKEYALFPEFAPTHRTECSYEKFKSELSYDEVISVVKSGDKYKWFIYRGSIYIARKFGSSQIGIVTADYTPSDRQCVRCNFNYNKNPFSLIREFVESGIFDCDKIIEKYECGQECIDNMVRDLIKYRNIERNEDGSNKYKVRENGNDLDNMIFNIEHGLML